MLITGSGESGVYPRDREVGCGKTTLIRNLIKGSNGNVVLSKVFNTKVTSEQLLSMINEDFGLNVAARTR